MLRVECAHPYHDVVGRFSNESATRCGDADSDEANDVLSIRLTSTAGGYRALDQPIYYRELIGRVGALPGITSGGMARYFGTVPDERGWYGPVSWSGEEQAATTAIYDYATPGFFQTVGIPLLRGRDFSWSAAPGSLPVVPV